MKAIHELYRADFPQEVLIRRILAEHIEKFINTYLKEKKGAHLLDVGCGTQPFRPVFESMGFGYEGLENF